MILSIECGETRRRDMFVCLFTCRFCDSPKVIAKKSLLAIISTLPSWKEIQRGSFSFFQHAMFESKECLKIEMLLQKGFVTFARNTFQEFLLFSYKLLQGFQHSGHFFSIPLTRQCTLFHPLVVLMFLIQDFWTDKTQIQLFFSMCTALKKLLNIHIWCLSHFGTFRLFTSLWWRSLRSFTCKITSDSQPVTEVTLA